MCDRTDKTTIDVGEVSSFEEPTLEARFGELARSSTTMELDSDEHVPHFVSAEYSSLTSIDNAKLEAIKGELIRSGHWGESDTSMPLLARIEKDLLCLENAKIDRRRVLLHHERMKNLFDVITRKYYSLAEGPFKRGSVYTLKSKEIGGPTTVLIMGGDPNMVSRSIIVSDFAKLGGFDPSCYDEVTNIAAVVFDIRWDDLHIEKSHDLFSWACQMKSVRLKYALHDRNRFVREAGYFEHIIALKRAFDAFIAADEARKSWLKYRETMFLIDDLLIYRVEWGGAESCPIYGAFESKFVGHYRGNCDWFIRNVKTNTQVWIPDLIVYQIGLFGFLQGEKSAYRLDIANYTATII